MKGRQVNTITFLPQFYVAPYWKIDYGGGVTDKHRLFPQPELNDRCATLVKYLCVLCVLGG